jgi:hypothetical protein
MMIRLEDNKNLEAEEIRGQGWKKRLTAISQKLRKLSLEVLK